nr:hypothetical protein [Microbacterium humi]
MRVPNADADIGGGLDKRPSRPYAHKRPIMRAGIPEYADSRVNVGLRSDEPGVIEDAPEARSLKR